MADDFFTAADDAELYAELGTSVVFKPAAGGSIPGSALFDEKGVVAFGNVITEDPTLRYSQGAFPAVKKDDAFVIRGASWRVRQVPQRMFDGKDLFVLLEKQA
ncbi:MAG TPA: hypothetical protein VLC92_01175 [Rhodocyclaceae bacterium]|nr:hypothetical protein [Rhodocyclaceae bacterium]